ncbi:hypothetical protein [Ureibacillus chungkukjangi]|nr:hypothetical protein [Ureibacillus chungkukjangi]
MRIPALPQTKDIEFKRRRLLFRLLRQILSKRAVKKKPFVRIPPRK